PAATPAAPAAPAAAPAPSAGVSTIKLKPVIRKPQIHRPVVGGSKPATPPPAASGASAAAVKKATQNLKAVTGPIPMQATLRKTGIIAEGILTPAQQQAAKSKTSRISLESAIGVAPATKEAPAPMKTIRLRRPTDIKPGGPAPLVPPRPPVSDVPPAEPSAEPAPAAGEEPGVTQKKTLKLHRPGIGVKRPTIGAAPAAPAGDVPDLPVADLPAAGNPAPFPLDEPKSGKSAGVPAWVAALSLITSIAALLAVGCLMWYLWQEGVGPAAGANEMPFIQM
ncbi:MAG: hypothetical protein J6V72_01770, partial [Kiritimatiellae bacterium]|nr:hypothetical protein [Kiritimatiellia bacterium]